MFDATREKSYLMCAICIYNLISLLLLSTRMPIMQVITSNSATPLLPSNLPTPLLTPLPSSDAIPINTRSSMFPVLHSVLQTNIVQRVWLMN